MQNFVYLVGDREAGECVVVDPAWEIDTIVRTAEADGLRITGALVTHTHQDHVGGSLADWGMPGRIPGVEELLGQVRAKVYVHRAEREFLRGFGSDLVQVESATDAPGRALHDHVHPHARPHPGLAVLPRRRAPGLGRHAVHPGVRPDGPAGR